MVFIFPYYKSFEVFCCNLQMVPLTVQLRVYSCNIKYTHISQIAGVSSYLSGKTGIIIRKNASTAGFAVSYDAYCHSVAAHHGHKHGVCRKAFALQ